MHEAFGHLAKRVGELQAALAAVLREVEQQGQREAKLLEQAEFGQDFDDEVAGVQEKVVGAMQEVLEHLEQADDQLTQARETLEEIPNL